MRMRSTGLGNTELIGDISDIESIGNSLIMHVRTTEPVRWHVRVAVTYKDLFVILKLILKGKVLNYFLLGFKKINEPPPSAF